jgi:hypothetical protein
MSAIQTALSSPRVNRVMLWVGAAVLAAGIVALVITFVGNGNNEPSQAFPQQPQQGVHPTLPAKSAPLKNANGVTIKKFQQLDPEMRSTIRTFLASAVARKNLGESWAVIAPSMKADYTYKSWKNAKALPIIPYPISSIKDVTYYLDYAATDAILVDLGLTADPALKIRPARFRLELIPSGKGANKQWLVDYWMPLWTPQLPVN